nr:PfkB family carbohydrate kinase [Rhodobacter sp.]
MSPVANHLPERVLKMKTLDVITIGRSSVDLYGAQVGGRLEDMGSFQKYVGGSPTNMATGTARLGLKSALITRVGDEHMGRFLREELARADMVHVIGLRRAYPVASYLAYVFDKVQVPAMLHGG